MWRTSTYETRREDIGQGAALVFYTDGLIERRGESLDVGLERLATAVAAGPDDPQMLCEHVRARLVDPADQYNDVTAVVERITG